MSTLSVSLITGRCGSTLLASVLDRCGFGQGQELFTEEEPQSHAEFGADRLEEYLLDQLSKFGRNDTFYFQITYWRYLAFKELFDFDVGEHLKLSVILRRDIFSQALSYKNAMVTGIWHTNQPAGVPISVNDERADPGFWLSHILEAENGCLTQAPDAPVFFYEDIAASPQITASSFLRYYGRSASLVAISRALSSQSTPRKIDRDGVAAELDQLVERTAEREVILDRFRQRMGGTFNG